jgi:hypothetical protein
VTAALPALKAELERLGADDDAACSARASDDVALATATRQRAGRVPKGEILAVQQPA